MRSYRVYILISGLLCLLTNEYAWAQLKPENKLQVTTFKVGNSFLLVSKKQAASIYVDSNDAQVVSIAAKAFQADIALVTNAKPVIYFNQLSMSSMPVIMGTLHHSALIDALVSKGKLKVTSIEGKWESFIICTIKNPMPHVAQALVIVGSDARGTAFGIFELSKKIGVSPWYWWADIIPEKKENLFVEGLQTNGPPSVKYRGIFLNDEDWGLQPWAAKKMDTVIKDIGPNTYAHIFELLLRLKANYIWPAMHPCTKAFYYYKDNAKVADKYAIVVGTSHCEPMLRNNVFEWTEHYKEEFGVEPKEWRYDLNKEQIAPYWEDRIKAVKKYESVITVGMRGIHDGSMPGPNNIKAKVKLLEEIIADQRYILTNTLQKPITKIPQIFCPYKEVLQLYRKGLHLPEDITIAWADDNFGYITQLSNKKEQSRIGGSGVYYHLSYWGDPHDYLWLSTNSPSLISYEMNKAYEFNAKKLWVFNVGDIKPAEMEINFALDIAYNIHNWQPTNAINYTKYWAEQNFGAQYANDIARIKNTYYRLAQAGKPEHLGMITYGEDDADKRLAAYKTITEQAELLYAKMPLRLKAAFYQLILYPVKGAYLMNQKILLARKSLSLASNGNNEALVYSQKSKAAYDTIQAITITYNKEISSGKWDGIMSAKPRALKVFDMPQVATPTMLIKHSSVSDSVNGIKEKPTIISAINFSSCKNISDRTITKLEGLGIGGSGISVMPFTAKQIDSSQAENSPYVDYEIPLSAGKHLITVKCLPTHNINQDYRLQYGISVNGEKVQTRDVNVEANTKQWDSNVIKGYSYATTEHFVQKSGTTKIRIFMLEPGLVINQIEIQ